MDNLNFYNIKIWLEKNAGKDAEEEYKQRKKAMNNELISEMIFSLLKKGILEIVPIRFISFRLIWLSERKSYGRIVQVRK